MTILWSRLPLGAKIGAVVLALPFALASPFLAYAGIALMNLSTSWARPAGHPVEVVVGFLSLAIYFALVFGLPLVVGGLLGAAVQRAVGKGGA